MDTAVKIIEEVTPVFKNGILIFVLCQLVVNVIKSDGFGIIFLLYPADTVLCHFPVWYGFLCRKTLLLFLFQFCF